MTPRAEQVDMMAGQVARQIPAGRIGQGRADAGLEGLPLQIATDAAERAKVETDLFSEGEHELG